MNLHDMSPAPGSSEKRWRVGRGIGSGNGKTSARGHKGAKCRSGYSRKRGFEGGQMPLARRLPKRGFVNIYAKPITAVNLSVFNAFDDGAVVTAQTLLENGLIKDCDNGLKVLGCGTLDKKVTIVAKAFSASAAEKIAAAGGKAEVK